MAIFADALVVVALPAQHAAVQQAEVPAGRATGKRIGEREAPPPARCVAELEREPQARHPVGFEKRVAHATNLAEVVGGANHPVGNPQVVPGFQLHAAAAPRGVHVIGVVEYTQVLSDSPHTTI